MWRADAPRTRMHSGESWHAQVAGVSAACAGLVMFACFTDVCSQCSLKQPITFHVGRHHFNL